MFQPRDNVHSLYLFKKRLDEFVCESVIGEFYKPMLHATIQKKGPKFSTLATIATREMMQIQNLELHHEYSREEAKAGCFGFSS